VKGTDGLLLIGQKFTAVEASVICKVNCLTRSNRQLAVVWGFVPCSPLDEN